MGSLLEGIEETRTQAKPAKASTGNAQKVKLTIVIVGLLVGGSLIAWNLGLFGQGEISPNSPQAAKNAAENATPPPPPAGAGVSSVSGSGTPAPTQPKTGPRTFTK